MSSKININVDGKSCSCFPGTTLYNLSRDFQDQYDHDIIAARVDGKLAELSKTLTGDCRVSFITTGETIGNTTYRRTALLVMMKAFDDVLGTNASRNIQVQYSMDRGLYCELRGQTKVTPDLLRQIEEQMHQIADAGLDIIKKTVSGKEAAQIFTDYGMTDKVDLFYYRRSSEVKIYILDNTIDYFYGYMAPDTSYVRYFGLYPYDEGFVLQLPAVSEPETAATFNPSPKLFHVLKLATEWGKLLDVSNVADVNRVIARGGFQDLVLVQEALMEKKIADIAAMIAESSKRLVMIAGPSSSGKTTFSHRLAIQLRALGLKPHPIPVDNYFRDRADTPKDESGKPDYEALAALDLERFNSDILSLLEGKMTQLPVFNFITGKRENFTQSLQIGPSDVLVIEGIHALNDKMTYRFPADRKFKIYISALTPLNLDDHNRIRTADARLIRRMCRDYSTRGADAKRTISMWSMVRRGEERNIFPFQESADVMFNSSLIYELFVLKQFAEPLLFSIRPDEEEYDQAQRLLKMLNYFLGVSSENIPSNSILREFIGGSCFNVS